MKKILIGTLLAALALGVWLWHRHGSADTAAEEEPKATAEVQTAILQRAAISETLPAFGTVEASPAGARVVTLGYDCVVRAVSAPAGARVSAGDPILEVAPTPDARLQLDSARSAAELADKSLAATRQRYDLRLATNQDLLAAQQAAEDARIKLASYQDRLAGSDGRIRAEAAGVVTKLDWQAGATVPAGTPLAVVTASGQLEAHLTVEAADAARIVPGASVTLTSANRPAAAPLTGAVRAVGGSVDPASGAVDVRVPLPADAAWYPGEHVEGAIETRRETGLVAPRSAVLPDDGKQVLYTVKAGKAVRHEVQTGIASADGVEVSGGDLQAGDTIVTVGNYELEDGMAVQAGSAPAGGAGDDQPGKKP
jgi:RND family efflux transporter MFP subunit